MKDFEGKVAVVTGAASGMGLAFATKFADAGMKVVLADIEAEPLSMAEAALKAKGATVLAQRTNVGDWDSISALADRAFSTFGNVHILCNNAGVSGTFMPDWELTLDDWKWVIDVNLYSVIHGIKAFLPRMLDNGEEGHIVNTASMAGMTTGLVPGPYQATKFAVVGLTEHLYKDLLRKHAKVTCSVLCPGAVATNIMDDDRVKPAEIDSVPEDALGQQRVEWFKKALAAGKQPEEVGEIVFKAIQDEQFYIFTADDSPANIQARMEDIVNLRNPRI